MTADIDKIEEHLAHAEHKHPHFADILDWNWNACNARRELANCRRVIRENEMSGHGATAKNLLACEVAEIFEAYHGGRFADAIGECYDAIAVLLRMVEMIGKEANVNNNNGNNINKETN